MGDNKSRIIYIDQLRTISIIWLVLINVAFIFKCQNRTTLEEYVLFSSFAFGVPIFLMLLGELMLDRDYSNLEFFFKNSFFRILVPFLLWNSIMAVLATSLNYSNFGLNIGTLITFASNFMTQHWYAWMLLGIYLSLPILSEFIRKWQLKGAEYYLILAIIASIIYQCLAYVNSPSYFNLTFFIGPLIYLFSGYYLENKKINLDDNKLVIMGFILTVISTAIIIYDMIVINHMTFTLLLHHYNFYTHSYLDVSVIVLAQATGIFLVFKYINNDVSGILLKIKNILHNKWILDFTTSISRSCYGIYLTHQSILMLLTLIFSLDQTNEMYGIPIISIVTLISSWLLMLLLKKVGIPTKYIGYD